ncbi:hypothetical protein [Halobacillus sp. Marseille-P3879]|uniref:hypothetical protein n=1 Tax=Halobacillus sp. Marseille-P3879 TaxID=2045014 RepID=UPI000C7A5FBE|nr:hypothetical protein [Halobacillus sp. Marseille-P3879]
MNHQRISSFYEDTRAPLYLNNLKQEHINHWHHELEEENEFTHHDLEHGLNCPCKIVTVAIYSFINSYD